MWCLRDPLIHPDQLAMPTPKVLAGSPVPGLHLGKTVARPILIKDAVATFGRERLPVLVAGLGHYDIWEMLLPAVYEVSLAECEAGWPSLTASPDTSNGKVARRNNRSPTRRCTQPPTNPFILFVAALDNELQQKNNVSIFFVARPCALSLGYTLLVRGPPTSVMGTQPGYLAMSER